MKKSLIRPVLSAALLMISATALAGKKDTNQVIIGSTSASGSLANARSSSNTIERIGCTILVSSNTENIFCVATTAQNVTKTCSSSNARMVNAVRSLNGDGHLQFDFNTSGQCTAVFVQNGSNWAPKAN